MPQSFAWTSESHGERKKRQHDSSLIVILICEHFVSAYPGEVIDVTGLGHADDRMQEQHTVHLLDCSFGQLFVRALERVSRLKRDNVFETFILEPAASLSWSQS